jgi:hypothetical protein
MDALGLSDTTPHASWDQLAGATRDTSSDEKHEYNDNEDMMEQFRQHYNAFTSSEYQVPEDTHFETTQKEICVALATQSEEYDNQYKQHNRTTKSTGNAQPPHAAPLGNDTPLNDRLAETPPSPKARHHRADENAPQAPSRNTYRQQSPCPNTPHRRTDEIAPQTAKQNHQSTAITLSKTPPTKPTPKPLRR